MGVGSILGYGNSKCDVPETGRHLDARGVKEVPKAGAGERGGQWHKVEERPAWARRPACTSSPGPCGVG